MNRVVWVYRIPVTLLTASFTTVHRIPEAATFLHCREQAGSVALWYEVDPEAPTVVHHFQLHGTGGGELGPHLTYVGTCLFDDGVLVLHVYEADT